MKWVFCQFLKTVKVNESELVLTHRCQRSCSKVATNIFSCIGYTSPVKEFSEFYPVNKKTQNKIVDGL